MRNLTGIVLLLALICATAQLYSYDTAECHASIDCEGGWTDPTAECEESDIYAELHCLTFVIDSRSDYTIHAQCWRGEEKAKVDDEDCDYTK
jgi:hypothetical protein